MSELDPQSTALVEALRSEAAGDDPKERVRARLAATGVLGAAASAPALAAAQAPALVKPVGSWGLAKLVVLGTGALVAGTLAVLTVSQTRQPTSKVEARARPVAAAPRANTPSAPLVPSNERAAREPATAMAPARKAPAQAEPQRRAARRAQHTPREVVASPEPASSSLAAESALLARAVRALNDGRSDEAHALLHEHAQRFPRGLLVRERELALERLGAANGL